MNAKELGLWPGSSPRRIRSKTKNGRSLMNAKELGLRLGLSPRRIRSKAESGEIPSIKLGNGPKAPVRFDLKAVLRALRAYKTNEKRSR